MKASLPPLFISILILYWNNTEHVIRCLEYLAKQTVTNFEIVIADNVTLIPFLHTPLTKAPNPVKVFEYLKRWEARSGSFITRIARAKRSGFALLNT